MVDDLTKYLDSDVFNKIKVKIKISGSTKSERNDPHSHNYVPEDWGWHVE